jgi:hypothetical protein
MCIRDRSATITAANNMRGEGKITYSFDMPSGESFNVEETFWVGKPDIFLDYGYITSGDGGDGYVCTDQTGNEIDLSYNNEKENGNCDNYEIKLTNISGSQIIDQFYTSNGIADLDYSNLSEGFYLLYVRAHNTCGWSEWVDTEIEIIDCSAMFLMFTPNPATAETTLSIESTSGKEEFKSESYEWDIEIYDSNQIMKEKKLKIKEKEYKLNTADWKEGVYFARVKLKDKIISGQLVVNK